MGTFGVHVFGESGPIVDHTGWLHLPGLLCSLGDNKRACRSQLHLSKHLTRAIHKQSFALTHFLPRSAFSFYPLGLRGTAGFACRVPLFVSGNSCILPQCATKGRDTTWPQECPFCLNCSTTSASAIKTKGVSSYKNVCVVLNRCVFKCIHFFEATKNLLRQVPKK